MISLEPEIQQQYYVVFIVGRVVGQFKMIRTQIRFIG